MPAWIVDCESLGKASTAMIPSWGPSKSFKRSAKHLSVFDALTKFVSFVFTN